MYKARGHLGPCRVAQCMECGLLFLSEKYGRLEDFGDVRKMAAGYLSRVNIEFNDKDLYEYNKHRNETFRRYHELVNQDKKGGNILDIGCGNGFFLSFFDSGQWKRKGVDHNRENWQECLRSGLDVFWGSFLSYPEEDYFDVIAMLEYIEHTEDPLSELIKSYSLLKKGGLLLVETGNADSAIAKERGTEWAYFTAAPDHKYFFSSETLSKIVRTAGFQQITFPEGENQEVVLLTARRP